MSDTPRRCSLGAVIPPTATLRFVYDAHSSQRSATVCAGWMRAADADLPRPTAPPAASDAAPDAPCVVVTPGGTWASSPTQPPADAVSYWIRVEFDDADDRGLLTLFLNGEEVLRGRLDGCGVATWTLDVNR